MLTHISVRGAREHNLKGVDLDIPLNAITCVTGVSGSGKSTLVHDVLYAAVKRAKGGWDRRVGAHRSLEGTEYFSDVVLVDLRHPLMQPARDPLRSFVFHAADRAVRTVLVDGEVILADGQPVHLDPEAAAATLAEAQARMIRDVPKIDYAQRAGDVIAPLSLPVQ